MAASKLNKPQEMRDLSRTAGPSGTETVVAPKTLRFEIQKHAASHLHFDLRLECDGAFKFWWRGSAVGRTISNAGKTLRPDAADDKPLTVPGLPAKLTAWAGSCDGERLLKAAIARLGQV